MRAIVSGCAAALCLSVAGWAQAQQTARGSQSGQGAEEAIPLHPQIHHEGESGQGAMDEGTVVPESQADKAATRHHLQTGLDVTFGAGMSDFTGSLGDHTRIGPSWLARAGYAITPNIGVEAGYAGMRNVLSDPDLAESHAVLTTAGNLDIKLMAPIAAGSNATVRPYAFGGAGAALFGITGDNPKPLYDTDSSLQFPVGAGADVLVAKAGGGETLNIGARFDYLIGVANRVSTEYGGDQYSVNGNLGLHF